MKNIFIILFLSFSSLSQESRTNYIISNNFASEAEFYFHEQNFDSAVYYYEKAFEFVSEPHPMQRYNYAKSLWKLMKYELSIEATLQSGMRKIDTNWFSGLSVEKYENINSEMHRVSNEKDSIKNCSFYNAFMDSIINIDQFHRKNNYPNDSTKWATVSYYDSCNAQAIIHFTKKTWFSCRSQYVLESNGGYFSFAHVARMVH